MSRVALTVASAPNEWLRAVRGPQGLVVELPRIPQSLIGDLGHANGMRGRARAAGGKSTVFCGIVHVILVVGAVEVLAVPASGYY